MEQIFKIILVIILLIAIGISVYFLLKKSKEKFDDNAKINHAIGCSVVKGNCSEYVSKSSELSFAVNKSLSYITSISNLQKNGIVTLAFNDFRVDMKANDEGILYFNKNKQAFPMLYIPYEEVRMYVENVADIGTDESKYPVINGYNDDKKVSNVDLMTRSFILDATFGAVELIIKDGGISEFRPL